MFETAASASTRFRGVIIGGMRAVLLILLLTSSAIAADIDVELGWGGIVRSDRWTIAHATVEGDGASPATIQWYVPRPGRQAMVLRQAVALDNRPQTFAAVLPVGPSPHAVHATLLDEHGRTLAHWPDEPPTAEAFEPRLVDTLVGVAGTGPTPELADAVRIPLERLPQDAIGFDALDALILSRLDLSTLPFEQQQAIATWTRRGGDLWLWLDAAPLPEAERSPLLALMAASLPGLPTGRDVRQDGTAYVPLANVDGTPLITSVDVGRGRLNFLHVDPTLLPPDVAPAIEVRSNPLPSYPQPPRAVVVEHELPLWPIVPLALIGPLDWFLNRRRPAWRRLAIGGTTLLGLYVLLVTTDLGDEAHRPETATVTASPATLSTIVVYRGTFADEAVAWWRLATTDADGRQWTDVPASLRATGVEIERLEEPAVVEVIATDNPS